MNGRPLAEDSDPSGSSTIFSSFAWATCSLIHGCQKGSLSAQSRWKRPGVWENINAIILIYNSKTLSLATSWVFWVFFNFIFWISKIKVWWDHSIIFQLKCGHFIDLPWQPLVTSSQDTNRFEWKSAFLCISKWNTDISAFPGEMGAFHWNKK